MTTFGLIGWGRIGQRVARCLSDSSDIQLTAVLTKGPAPGADPTTICDDLSDLISRAPDIVVECASPDALLIMAPPLLRAGVDVMPLSLAAFAAPEAEARLLAAARAGPGRLEIPPGAIGSFGFLAAAREDELSQVVIHVAYPPGRWAGTPAMAFTEVKRETVVFRGSAREAVQLFPRHVNVVVGAALAGLGLDRTEVVLSADPALRQAVFRVEAQAGPGNVTLLVNGRDTHLGADPVDYTTFSLIRLLRRHQAPVMI